MLLQLASLSYETKIVIYKVVDDQLWSEIFNFGFMNRLMLACNGGKYFLIKDNKPNRQIETYFLVIWSVY